MGRREPGRRRRGLVRALQGVLGTGAAVYLAVCGLMFMFQEQLLFIPDRHVERTPSDVGLAFEPVSLETEDGESIAAWFVPADPGAESHARGVVLYSHGNAGNLGNRVSTVERLHALGLDVLAYDYHGFGESTGSPGETQTYLDARAAWDWLVHTRRVPPERIVIWGRSLGGAIAVWLATHLEPGQAPAALVVESSFTSIPDVASTYYPYLPVRLLVRHEYPSLTRMNDVSVPVLVAHGPEDRVVPYDHGRALFDVARKPKQFVELSGGHNDTGLTGRAHRARLEAFLASVLDPL